jgi:hypothetical protein
MYSVLSNIKYAVRLIWKINPWYVSANFIFAFENVPRRLLNILIIKYVVDAAAAGEEFTHIVLWGCLFLGFNLLFIVIKNLFVNLFEENIFPFFSNPFGDFASRAVPGSAEIGKFKFGKAGAYIYVDTNTGKKAEGRYGVSYAFYYHTLNLIFVLHCCSGETTISTPL